MESVQGPEQDLESVQVQARVLGPVPVQVLAQAQEQALAQEWAQGQEQALARERGMELAREPEQVWARVPVKKAQIPELDLVRDSLWV